MVFSLSGPKVPGGLFP